MAITIKDIARQARVSHSTVSRALRNNATIPPRTAQRIKRLAAKMGYVPSAVARSLKTSQSQAWPGLTMCSSPNTPTRR